MGKGPVGSGFPWGFSAFEVFFKFSFLIGKFSLSKIINQMSI